MAPELAAAKEGDRPQGADWERSSHDPPLSGFARRMKSGIPIVAPDEPARAVPADPGQEPRARLGRLKLNAVKDEFRRSELAFMAAKHALGEMGVAVLAGRIADALGRACRAIDTVEKGAAVYPALEALVGVSKIDPASRPAAFLDLAGKSIAIAGRMMASSGFADVAYWGRALSHLAGGLAACRPARVA